MAGLCEWFEQIPEKRNTAAVVIHGAKRYAAFVALCYVGHLLWQFGTILITETPVQDWAALVAVIGVPIIVFYLVNRFHR